MSRVFGRALAVLPAELGGSAPGPLHTLLSALASASSRQEEESLVRKELSIIHQQLNTANFNPDVASECLVRLIYCATLGYPIGFCTIHALTLAQRGSSWHKRLGYLACCLLLHENHELLLLLVNTLMKDLQSGGPLEMGMALMVAGQLTPPHAVSSIMPIVIDKLAHSREFVRQKAVAALTFLTFRSCSDKSLDNENSDNCHPSNSYQRDVFLRAFGDRDPSVMAASLPALLHLAKRDPDWCRTLVPALVGVLRQVIEGRLHGDFSFHGVPSPWLQIDLLRLFSLLGKGDHGTSQQIYEVLGECMERARSKQMSAWAVLSECIRTLSVLPPHLELWTRASDFVGEMLQSSNANLQYMGVRCLADMARVEPGTVLCHRPSVMCALEQPDPAIRRRTLELLCRVVGQENVEAVCGHLLSALRDTQDPYEARSLASRTLDLAYRFSPNSEWLVGIVTEVLSMREEIIPPDEPGRFLWLLVKEEEESAESLKFHALQALMASSTAISSRTSQPLLRAITWVLGEISHVQPDLSPADISSRLSRILVPPASRQGSHARASSLSIPIETQAWLLTGLSKVLSRQANELGNASLITEQIREESKDGGQDVEMTREAGGGGEGGSFARKDTDHFLEKAEIFSKVDDQIKNMNASQKNQTSSSPEVIEIKVNGSQAGLSSEECNESGMGERVDIMGTSDVDQDKVCLDKYETEAGKSEISKEDSGTRQIKLPLPTLDLLSDDPCIQQLIDELRRLWASPSLFATVLPASPGCQTPLVDPSLPFLDGFVAEAMRKGAAPYIPPQLRQLDKQGSSYDAREIQVSGAFSESVGHGTSPTSTAGNSWAQEAGNMDHYQGQIEICPLRQNPQRMSPAIQL
uniref:AP-4 complex subunit epsilon-1-like isoform X2 n=2 Tax=Myxine glutinosa TaxID=7769 RepID=UPI00358F3785